MTVPGPDTGQPPPLWWSPSLAYDEGFGMNSRDGLVMRDERSLPGKPYIAHESIGWRRRADLPDDAVRLVPAPSPGVDDDARERALQVAAVARNDGVEHHAGDRWADELRPVIDALATAGLLRTPTDPASAFRAGFAAGHDWCQAPTTRDDYDTAVRIAWQRHAGGDALT